ncbi:MAG TPA: electron transfer flavoprotein subunit alpha/FixB family protein [Candidatus Binatia bacterium]|jgi:electron transfer flavoprotein alpha subunit|nr:electron transfer flavoprotein subunit alpha/FixB family protein [Candidatus Binatia bacterium]
MARDILVLVEHSDGKLDSTSSQLLAIGSRLAREMKAELMAAAIGHQMESVVDALRGHEIDRILIVDNPALSLAAAEVQAHIFAEIAQHLEPRLVLLSYGLAGMELAPAIATKLGVNALTNCVNVEFRHRGIVVTRPVFDGTMHAEIALEENGTTVVALQKGPPIATSSSAKQAVVQSIPMDVKSIPSRSRVLEIIEEPRGDVDLSKAELIVAVGRGVGDKDKIRFAAELAEALGGMLACSRPVVDVGWMPRERQVGASGKSVAPKVYVACGISGATQHLAGMRDSKRIIAINKDPNAPIFQVAHVGVVGDLFEIIPALTKAAQAAWAR